MVATWALLSAFHNWFLLRRVNCTLFFQEAEEFWQASSQALPSWEIPVCKQQLPTQTRTAAFSPADSVAQVYSSICLDPFPHTGKETGWVTCGC